MTNKVLKDPVELMETMISNGWEYNTEDYCGLEKEGYPDYFYEGE